MRTYTLILPRVPISQNSDEWRHRYTQLNYRATWQREIWVLCKEQRIPPLEGVRLSAIVYWSDRRRRDLDNHFAPIFKAVQDALMDAGVIPADDPRYIPELPGLRFDFDKLYPRTEITISEV